MPPGEQRVVPQWQRSKGSLILTAALELSTNQVTHFYSGAKNTAEMIRMMDLLVEHVGFDLQLIKLRQHQFLGLFATRLLLAFPDDNRAQQKDWARLFLVPGMTHCAGGPSLDNFDALGAVVDWVENGAAPDRINSTGAGFPGRSRPLCAFPAHAQYKGQGSTEDAANFVCRQ